MYDDNDWSLVVECLAPRSEIREKMPVAHLEVCYLAANGFGRVDLKFIREQCFDWSHIRDSDEAGVRRVAEKLRELGYGEKPAEAPVFVSHADGFVVFEMDPAAAAAMLAGKLKQRR